jgi:hypothetical protein
LQKASTEKIQSLKNKIQDLEKELTLTQGKLTEQIKQCETLQKEAFVSHRKDQTINQLQTQSKSSKKKEKKRKEKKRKEKKRKEKKRKEKKRKEKKNAI